MNKRKRDSENNRHWTIATIVLVLVGGAMVTTGAINRVAAQSEPVTENFELGDGVDPYAPGTADVVGASLQNGPDWDDLFAAGGSWKDLYDEFGNAGSNGMPDFLDTWGRWKLRRDTGFVIDDISAGSGPDGTAFLEGGALGAGTVGPAYDIGNAYAYTLIDRHKNFVLYAGLERLTNGPARIILELNRGVYEVVDGAVAGELTIGDARIQADFGAEGVNALEVYKWAVIDPESGAADWVLINSLPLDPANPAEQCDATMSLCVNSNAVSIQGGSWENYGADGAPITDLAPNTFLEVGVNLTALIGVHSHANYYNTRYTSIQITSYDDAADPNAIDYALSNFVRAKRLAR